MIRISIWLMAACLLCGVALADDDGWDGDDVVNDERVVEAEPGRVDSPSDVNDPSYWGPYFGTGDEFIHSGGEVIYLGEGGFTSTGLRGDWVYRPTSGYGGSLHDNVFGPMWGVPPEALATMGYDSEFIAEYYFGERAGVDVEYTEERSEEGGAADHGINRYDSEDDYFYE